MDMLKAFFITNWKTSMTGVLSLGCGMATYFSLLPASWSSSAEAFCALMISLGLIAAKDGDKSNAPIPSSHATHIG